MKTTPAKPYAKTFTFDPTVGDILYMDELGTVCRIGDVPDYDEPRQAATARLLAAAPGALAGCVGALSRIMEGNTNNIAIESVIAARTAIARAEAILNPEAKP